MEFSKNNLSFSRRYPKLDNYKQAHNALRPLSLISNIGCQTDQRPGQLT